MGVTTNDDSDLLDRYARCGDEAAFRELVRRHLDLVYSSASRRVGDGHLAEDVTQAVFMILSQKAKAARRVTPLSRWLLATVRYAAANALKLDRRRRHHQGVAAASRAAGACSPNPSDVLVWQEIAAELDDAVLKLSPADRTAVLLRFFEQKPIGAVAHALNTTEAAAGMRLTRAVEKLRKRLNSDGTVLMPAGAAGLEALLATNAVGMASAGLWTSTTALVGGAAGASTTSLTIAEGAMIMMSWAKVKTTVAVAALAVIGTGSVLTLNQVLGQDPDGATPAIALVQAQALATAPAGVQATLKNGVAVELLGVAEYPATGRKWWAADGSPLGRAPYQHLDKRATPWGLPDLRDADGNARGLGEAEVSREIAVRVNREIDGQPEPATLRWEVRGTGSTWWPEVEDEANRTIPNVYGLPISLPGSMAKRATLRINVAAGLWNTLFVAPAATGGSQRGDDDTFDLKVSEVKGESQFVFSRTGIKRGLDERILAIDTTGESHSLVLKRTTSTGTNQTDTYHLPKALASLKEVRFQQRPFNQWISFGELPLHQEQLRKISIATSDDPIAADVK